jgi:uncharacterized protein (TIGR02646 family)
MRAIVRGAEPASLTQHRLTPHADYENYPDKDTLRASLVKEQRGLCCYCLSRIQPKAGRMKIAHWHSQDLHPEEQLAYLNLLGACLGNKGQSLKLQHCDTLQRNRDISRNPANPAHRIERFVHYEADGRIRSHEPTFDAQLNEVLGLNVPILKNNRKAVLEAFKTALLKRGELSRTTLERWLSEWNGDLDQNELPEFCQVVVYWLRKRLARA